MQFFARFWRCFGTLHFSDFYLGLLGFPSAKAVVIVLIVGLSQAPVALSNQLSLPSQSAAPGSSVVFPVVFASESGLVSGVQFDLQYDSSAMSLVVTVGDAARYSGKSLYSVDLAPNKKRFLVVGLNQNVIPSGALVNIFVNLNTNAASGVYPLGFSNVVGANTSGQLAPMTGSDGAMSVQGSIGHSTRLQPTGVLSGASLVPGPVAPGEVVTLIGSAIGPASPQQPAGSPSSTVLDGTSVLFDGTPAPLLYAAPNQINLVVPYEVAGKSVTQMQVANGRQVVAGLSLSVTEAAPGIFTLDSSGVGPGAVLNQDLTVNSPSNPAERGSVVVLYAAGAGQTDPPGTDGQIAGDPLPKPILPISVQIGGLDAKVLYEGAAPGLIAGVLQVNCRMSASVTPGYALPVFLKVGTLTSQPGVTIAVR